MQLQELIKYLTQHKDPKVKQAGELIHHITNTNYLSRFVTLRDQMDSWDEQIRKSNVDITLIDPDDKSFERVHKYFTEMTFYIKSLEELKSKMLPSDLAKAEESKPRSTEEILNAARKS